MTFKELRQISGMTQKEFGEYFEIPKRTIENWDEGKSKCPEYLLKLMEYKLTNEVSIAGYRQASDVAREIFEEIENYFMYDGKYIGRISQSKFTELKKKYTS